jgi:hypothetical protein
MIAVKQEINIIVGKPIDRYLTRLYASNIMME